MSKSHFPGANVTAQYWAGKFRGSNMNTNCACIHTTEGFSWPSYGGGASAPHMTILPNIKQKTISIRQHFPAGKSSRALVNLAGGVETNTLNVFQIELIGTCDSRYQKSWFGKKAGVDYIYWPDAPQWLLEAIAPVFRWLDKEWVNFRAVDATPRGWTRYPESYGIKARQRMSFSEWKNAYGIFGHQHVPENTHGDPGNFPIAKLLEAINGVAPKPEPPKPPKPSKLKRYFGHAHLNTWGDSTEGARTLEKRLPGMVRDLVEEVPEVITLNEVRDSQQSLWRKALKPHGYKVILGEYGNVIAVLEEAVTEVERVHSFHLPKSAQGEGRDEVTGEARIKVNGHWQHIITGHLDYRSKSTEGKKNRVAAWWDKLRVKQGKVGLLAPAKRFADRYKLPTWKTRTSWGVDSNSHNWVRQQVFEPAGIPAVVSSGLDQIYSARPTIHTDIIETESDHPILLAVYGKKG